MDWMARQWIEHGTAVTVAISLVVMIAAFIVDELIHVNETKERKIQSLSRQLLFTTKGETGIEFIDKRNKKNTSI